MITRGTPIYGSPHLLVIEGVLVLKIVEREAA